MEPIKSRGERPGKPLVKPEERRPTRFDDAAIMLFVFGSGAALMALEIVGSRVLAPNFGNSIYTWGSLITVVLAALSLGYALGGRLADRHPSARLLAAIGIAAAAAIALVPLLGPDLSDAIRARDFGPRFNPLLATLTLFFPASALLGMASPFAIRIQGRELHRLGRTAGSLYALSTAGSICGTLATAFFLIPAIGVRAILFCLAAIMLIISVVLAVRPAPARAAALLGGLALVGFIPAAAGRMQPSVAGKPDITVREYAESAYHNIAVADYRDARLLFFDQQMESGIYRDSGVTYCEYVNMLPLCRLFVARPNRILFIGGGGGVGPNAFRRDLPEANIDVVEIDPAVADISRRYFGLAEDPRLRVIVADGRLFARNSQDAYDIIILDAYSISGQVPFHLMTREFLQELQAHLTPDGVVLMNLISGLHDRGGRLYEAEIRTFQAVFPQVYAFPRDYCKRPESPETRNIMIVGTRDSLRVPASELERRAELLVWKGEVTSVGLERFVADYAETHEFSPGIALTDDYAPVENLQMYN